MRNCSCGFNDILNTYGRLLLFVFVKPVCIKSLVWLAQSVCTYLYCMYVYFIMCVSSSFCWFLWQAVANTGLLRRKNHFYLNSGVISGEMRYLLTEFSLGARAKTDVRKVNPRPPKVSVTVAPSVVSKNPNTKLTQVGWGGQSSPSCLHFVCVCVFWFQCFMVDLG